MKKHLLLTLLFLFSFNIYSQTTFEKGHFITNSGEKVVCLIKNLDLLNNPKSIIYKLSSDSKETIGTISDVKAFEIYNVSSYERHNVKIDRSSEDIGKMDLTRKIKFNDEQLFLKYLIKGKANLYYYAEPNFSRFFYSINDSKVNQLIFKSFLTGDRSKIKKITILNNNIN